MDEFPDVFDITGRSLRLIRELPSQHELEDWWQKLLKEGRARMTAEAGQRVAFLGRIDGLDVKPASPIARVIVNPRTGSVVMNQKVTLEACAVAHGSLSVVVDAGQPQFGQGADIQVKQDNGSLMNVKAGANLADVVKALNALGANPLDLLAILQAMKMSGSLRAELEII